MIINSFNNTFYPNRQQRNRNVSFNGQNEFIRIGNSCLKQIGDTISPAVYDNISPSIKSVLENVTPKRVKELAQLNCFAAIRGKAYFDKSYGRNNYTLIAMGRSVASIAETMRFLGADVKIIPLSGLREKLPKTVPDVDVYRKYLDSIGINIDLLEKNPNRNYILFDYTYSGNSLCNADSFFRRDIFGKNPCNFFLESINQVLGKDFQENFHTLFSLNRFKDFSSVGKLDILNLKNCFSQASEVDAVEYKSNMAKYLRKIFLFNVCDCLRKGKYQNVCEEEFKALDRHYFSQEAMRARFSNWLQSGLKTYKG